MTDYKHEIEEILLDLASNAEHNECDGPECNAGYEYQKAKKRLHQTLTQLIEAEKVKARIDELERLQKIDAFNSAYIFQGDQRQEKLIRNRIKELSKP